MSYKFENPQMRGNAPLQLLVSLFSIEKTKNKKENLLLALTYTLKTTDSQLKYLLNHLICLELAVTPAFLGQIKHPAPDQQ